MHAVQKLEDNPNTLRIHEYLSHVELLYKRALEKIKVLPKKEAEKINSILDDEWLKFTRLLDLIGTPQSYAKAEEIGGIKAVNFLKKWQSRRIPNNIRVFSCSNLSEKQLELRQRTANRKIKECGKKYKQALNILDILECKDKKTFRKLKKENDDYILAFKMYAKGFSGEMIKEYTGERVLKRIKYGSYPPLLSSLSTKLGLLDIVKRKEKAEVIRVTAFKRYKSHESKKGSMPKEVIIELRKLDLALKLYERGLTPAAIQKLTKLPARSWIVKESLPLRKLREEKTYKIPSQITPNSAYVLGAYIGSFVSYEKEVNVTFFNKKESEIRRLREIMQKEYSMELPNVYEEKGRYAFSLSRASFLKELQTFLNINNSSEPDIPEIILKNSSMRKAFLTGYLAFEGHSLSTSRFSISRSNQPKIIKTAAIALGLEGIYCNISYSENYCTIYIGESSELKRFFSMFPNIGDPRKRKLIEDEISMKKSVLSSLSDYLDTMSIINTHFSDKNLDFTYFFNADGLTEPEINSLKRKIQHWKNGNIPDIYRRYEAIKNLTIELYPRLEDSI